jgi:hypothetical protein
MTEIIGGQTLLSESFFRLGALPIMVCVLTFSGDHYIVGYSMSRPAAFDENFARSGARRHAIGSAKRLFESGKIPSTWQRKLAPAITDEAAIPPTPKDYDGSPV